MMAVLLMLMAVVPSNCFEPYVSFSYDYAKYKYGATVMVEGTLDVGYLEYVYGVVWEKNNRAYYSPVEVGVGKWFGMTFAYVYDHFSRRIWIQEVKEGEKVYFVVKNVNDKLYIIVVNESFKLVMLKVLDHGKIQRVNLMCFNIEYAKWYNVTGKVTALFDSKKPVMASWRTIKVKKVSEEYSIWYSPFLSFRVGW